MKKVILLVLGLTLLLSACSTQVEQPLAVVQVNIELPDNVVAGEEAVLKAHISYGEEPVSDADEVQFEIWQEDKKDESVWIDAELEDEGTYRVTKMFAEAGTYLVQSHVTAKDMHVMPTRRLEVMEGSTGAGSEL